MLVAVCFCLSGLQAFSPKIVTLPRLTYWGPDIMPEKLACVRGSADKGVPLLGGLPLWGQLPAAGWEAWFVSLDRGTRYYLEQKTKKKNGESIIRILRQKPKFSSAGANQLCFAGAAAFLKSSACFYFPFVNTNVPGLQRWSPCPHFGSYACDLCEALSLEGSASPRCQSWLTRTLIFCVCAWICRGRETGRLRELWQAAENTEAARVLLLLLARCL